MKREFAAAIVLALSVGACTGDDPAVTPTPTPSETGPVVRVSATDSLTFSPREIRIAPGTTVIWTATGQVDHTVTFDANDGGGDLPAGRSLNATFPRKGTFGYRCTIHPPNMVGTVIVE